MIRHSGGHSGRGYGHRMFAPQPWEPVPWWIFWRRWMGYDIRRREFGLGYLNDDTRWAYGRSKQVARLMLQERYDPKPPVGSIDLSADGQ